MLGPNDIFNHTGTPLMTTTYTQALNPHLRNYQWLSVDDTKTYYALIVPTLCNINFFKNFFRKTRKNGDKFFKRISRGILHAMNL